MAVGSALKKEIASINSIKKITSAMKLVATVKLKRVAKRVSESKPYFAEVYTVFNDIISRADNSNYQAKGEKKENKKTCWVVINSNFGLCGGYNINVNKLVLESITKNDEIIAIGNKAKSFFENRNYKVSNFFTNGDVSFSYNNAREIADNLLLGYNNNEYDEIKIAYTKFINNLSYEPTILQLLPIEKKENAKDDLHHGVLTEFEPSAEVILETAVPMYMNTVLFSCVVESQVSEQASRRNAMENATDNASDLIEKYSLEYNRKRQAAITQEITEIVSGAGAQNN